MWVKICGVRSVEQALWAQACGADAVGLNLHAPSPRSISVGAAAEIAAAVELETILVVVDRSSQELAELVEAIGPSSLQLHGDAPSDLTAWLGVPAYRAFRAGPAVEEQIRSWAPDRFLLDAHVLGLHGGTGRQVDQELARRCCDLGSLILAGGLRPDNVAAAISQVQPWGVDVASGVETAPGRQDPGLVEAFIAAATGRTG
jgi:phosphoribosylanthranilate isomerase